MAAIDRALASGDAFRVGLKSLGFADVIIESWRQCEQTGVAPDSTRLKKIPESELERRIENNRYLIDIAAPHLKWVAAGMAGIPHVVCLTDRDGIILRSIHSDPEIARSGALEPGFDWSERMMGTNGAGTALTSDHPVVVVRREHYSCAVNSWTCVGAPIHGPDGSVIGAIDASTTDLSENPERLVLVAYAAYTIGRELSECIARRADGEGGRLLRRASMQRARLQKRRESVVRSRETALAMAAHEVRTPLNALRVQLEVLAEKTRGCGGLPDDYGGWILNRLEGAIASAEKISRLINDFMDLSLASAGKLKIERGSADLVALVREVILRTQAVEPVCPPITLTGPKTILGNWDWMRIDQIIANLVSNAVHHSRGLPIEVVASADEIVARIEVRDHGVGIPPERIDTIFEPFETTAPSLGHFGLGLSIVKLILHSMGGKISVSSKVGEGSSFVVELPRK